jgi:hypothetical protein
LSPTIKPAEVAWGMPKVVSFSTVDGDTTYTLSDILWSFSVTVLASHIGTRSGIGNCANAVRDIKNRIKAVKMDRFLFGIMIFG